MREGDGGRVEPLIVREGGTDDRGYMSMLFSDLGDFPPPERPLEVENEGAEPHHGVDASSGKRSPAHAGPNGSLTVKPQAVRPFIEEVLNVPTAPEARGSESRWRMAAVSFVAFLAVGGTAAAVLSMGYQASGRDRQLAAASAAVFPQVDQESGSTAAVTPASNPSGFRGCTRGEGLSPLGLMLVARDFVPTTSEPAVCLPAEAPRKKRAPEAKPKPPADQTIPTTVGTAPSGSSGSGGSSPASGGGSGGGEPGTGTGGGGTDPTPAPPPPPPPPPDGGTTEPDIPGKGWGKGGKPKPDPS
ncbi:MAG TPA: hypothetical protein VHI54_05105 [Actinomycetota bacterium]|nr:hypothetical protein [Actinomycetota bacterium]